MYSAPGSDPAVKETVSPEQKSLAPVISATGKAGSSIVILSELIPPQLETVTIYIAAVSIPIVCPVVPLDHW